MDSDWPVHYVTLPSILLDLSLKQKAPEKVQYTASPTYL